VAVITGLREARDPVTDHNKGILAKQMESPGQARQ